MRDEYYNKKGKAIPRKELSKEQRLKKDQWYHPNPPVGVTAGVKTIIPPTWMHGMIHSMVMINILMMLLVDRRTKEWAAIVNALKLQYNYLENGDIVTCGDEVLKFSQKFRFFFVILCCLFPYNTNLLSTNLHCVQLSFLFVLHLSKNQSGMAHK